MVPSGHGDDPFASMSPAKTPDLAAVSPAPVHTDGVAGVVDSVPCADQEQQQQHKSQDPSITTYFNSGSASAFGSSIHSPSARTRLHPIQAPAAADAHDPVSQMTKSMPPPDHDAELGSPIELSDARPLRTASVRADTKIVHPKPIAHPPAMSHTIPDKLIRSGSAAGNIAQLEATAERLSMTSSIDDAIRDLHGELKRSDSRRSAKLALSTMASVDENTTSPSSQLGRHLATASSIVSTNIAARNGGYSPAGFVMSPNTSLTSRLRSESTNSAGRPDATLDTILSRHGPGKSSVRSVRSTKLSLAEISESEPISLNQQAFEEADAAPPLDEQSAESLQLPEDTIANMPSTDAFHQMLQDSLGPPPGLQYAPIETPPAAMEPEDYEHGQRAESVHSNNTSEQARDAFIDFDGVHWEPQHEEDLYVPPEMEPDLPTPRPAAISMARPTSFIDPSTGQKMLYYPARVPAMLNLPPKLSAKPKTATRNQRRSQVLSAMMDVNINAQDVSTSPQRKRQSTFSDLKGMSTAQDPPVRDSWLPDPIANHRDSFAALSTFGPIDGTEVRLEEQLPTPEFEQAPGQDATPEGLRRPERLSKALKENRKSKASMLDALPPQLRASAFFDLPSVATDVEIKDGSAMATLDSILDASANAPVSAFTDHVFAGKLGSEVYGKERKNKARQSVATLNALAPEPQPKKRSSMMWLGKRSSSYNSDEQKRPHSSMAITSPQEDGPDGPIDGRITPRSVDSADKVIRVDGDRAEEDEEEDEFDDDGIPGDGYQGAPTTLLAELQLRKQEQKTRVRNMGKGLPNGNYATLLEMDTVAEAQQKNRQNKRVNLAWEDPDAHLDQNGSDDEDVPLAILAAMQRGAKNLADLERPMGLMERREQEDNEPLSHRRARLQGLEMLPPPPILNHRQSVMSFPASQALEVPSPNPEIEIVPSPEPDVEEIEEETLGARRRRLATKEGELPTARPVSTAFSAELLSQFGDAEEAKDEAKNKNGENKDTLAPGPSGEEAETLGQRRRRLQAEREAREREISYGNLIGGPPAQGHGQGQSQDLRRRLSLANVLTAHPKKENDSRAHEERLRVEEQRRAAQDRDAKMAAMRMQMPTSLPQIGLERSGGFLGGAFNDGTGGYGPKAALSSPAVNTQGLSPGKRSSVMTSYGPGYAAPMGQQPAYGSMNNYGNSYGAGNPMGPYNGMSSMSLYNGRAPAQMYGGGGMMPVPANNGSMDRVEQWRYGVRPGM